MTEVSSKYDEETTSIELWAPLRQLTLKQARQHSLLVLLIRFALILGALGSIGALAYELVQSTLNASASSPLAFRSDEVITMKNPRITGRSSSGDVFVLIADQATRQSASNFNQVDLKNPKLTDNSGSSVKAASGSYNRETQVIELFDGVEIGNDTSGYNLISSDARILIEDGRVEGFKIQEGSGPFGNITSDSYEVRNGGDEVAFKGNVSITLKPVASDGKRKDGEDSESSDGN